MEPVSIAPQKKDVTYEQLLKFLNLAPTWMRRKPEHPLTKLGYAISRMLPVVQKLIKPLNELQVERDTEIETLKLRHCWVNPTTRVIEYDIVKDAQGNESQTYRYTADKRIELNVAINGVLKKYDGVKYEEILQQKVDISNPYYTVEVPDGLSADELEIFSGIVVAPTASEKPYSLDQVRKAISHLDEATFNGVIDKLTLVNGTA